MPCLCKIMNRRSDVDTCDSCSSCDRETSRAELSFGRESMTGATNYPDIFRTAELFMKQNFPPVDTDEYVERICREANELSLRYAGREEERFYYDILYAVLNELCRGLKAAK